jgi:serine protease AprX
MKPPVVSATPPLILDHHVRLPEQLGHILRAAPVHAQGITGKGVRVAIIDSGFWPHPFYQDRGYRITYVPTHKEPDPQIDEYGHGTAQLASLFALAPCAEVLAIKCMDRDPSYALEKALALEPRVINCAWGFNIDHKGAKALPSEFQKMYRILRRAIRRGVTIVAAGGNGQQPFPGNMPEVIAAGGVYWGPDGHFEPSDVSSKFKSHIFPGREVPDVCGLVGNRPHGRLLLVPVPPRATLARRASFSTIAAGESTRTRAPGWAMFSGTSAATAMVTGTIALMLQARPELTPAQIKEMIMSAAQVLPSSGCRVLNVEGVLARVSS